MTKTLTTAEVAKRLAITQDGVNKLLQQRRLAGVKVGRSWLVTPQAVRAYKSGQLGTAPDLDFLSVRDAAEFLKVTIWEIYRLVRAKVLKPCRTVHRALFFSDREIRRYQKQR